MLTACKIIGISAMLVFLLTPFVIERLRSIYHTRREQRNGIGGTQDIAMWGSLVMAVCGMLALMSWIGWRSLRSADAVTATQSDRCVLGVPLAGAACYKTRVIIDDS